MSEKNQGMRVVKILEMLRNETDENHVLTRKDIETRLLNQGIEFERRTFYKDIELLTNAGFEIEHSPVGHAYGYYLVDKDFSVAELKLIVDALHAANFLTEKKTDELVDKVALIGGKYKAEDIKTNNIRFNTKKHTNEQILLVIEQLNNAIRDKKKITCKVFDLNYNGKQVLRHNRRIYTLEPIALIHYDDNYYVLCYDDERGVYPRRIDRLKNVSVLDESISDNAAKEMKKADEYTKGIFKMYGGDKVQVTFEFTESILNAVFDHFGEKIRITPTDKDGIYQTDVEAQISPTFWGWFFQFVGEMRIVSPDSLVKEYKKRLSTGNKIL